MSSPIPTASTPAPTRAPSGEAPTPRVVDVSDDGVVSGAKTDFKKTLDSYSARVGEFRMIDIPPLRYLMIDGHGDPNTAPAYAAALTALGLDYVVPPLEALWWASDMEAFTAARDKSAWDWTVLLMLPEWVSSEMFDLAVARTGTKDRPASLDLVRLDALDEGTCVQTLHIGPYDEETATLEDLHHRFIPEQRLIMTGKHHEVYLSDPRRTAPSRLRTILRQPVKRTDSRD